MSRPGIARIRKRDGSVVPFNPDKIEGAIYKALMATGIGERGLAAELNKRVIEIVEERLGQAGYRGRSTDGPGLSRCS